MNIKNRPDAFKAFSSLRIGENTFSDTQALLTMGGFAPLLIGEGDVPASGSLFRQPSRVAIGWRLFRTMQAVCPI